MKVKAHILKDISEPITVPASTLGWREFTGNPDWKENLVATTSLLWHPERNRLIVGMTSFRTDLMYEFDPADGTFHCLDFMSVSEPFEIKIHRSLALDSRGRVYGGTACLHREDQRHEGGGGRLFRYDFDAASYEFLGTPVPPDYIQTITLDEDRGILYGLTYPVFNFFAYDYRKRETIYSHYVGSISHIMALDDDGGCWSTWSPRTHYLYRYDPETNAIEFHHDGLPGQGAGAGLMYPGAGPVDMMLNGDDGYIYIGVANGDLVRLDPRTAETTYLGRPAPETRLPALEVGPDGRLWGICGFLGKCRLFAYDRERGTFQDYGHIADTETGEPIFIAHDMAFAPDGTLFVGETDTTQRASYLWELREIV